MYLYQDLVKIYKVNHKGGNVNFVKRNLEYISTYKNRGELNTDIVVRYFYFDYTECEFELFENFAHKHNINILRWKGGGNPYTSSPNFTESRDKDWWNKYILQNLSFNKSFIEYTKSVCSVALSPISINYRGEVSLCCLMPDMESTRVGNFLDDDFDILMYRRAHHPLCGLCSKRKTVPTLPYYSKALMRGLMKQLCRGSELVTDMAREASTASRLAGREVYFWGCGEMFWRKRHVFSECVPLCVLVDFDNPPAIINGLPVRHPDDVLLSGQILPIVIFAGVEARESIILKIHEKYPHFTEIFFCSDL